MALMVAPATHSDVGWLANAAMRIAAETDISRVVPRQAVDGRLEHVAPSASETVRQAVIVTTVKGNRRRVGWRSLLTHAVKCHAQFIAADENRVGVLARD
jgi:Ser/Thr protein kinase RdoA (MazF antagonist)